MVVVQSNLSRIHIPEGVSFTDWLLSLSTTLTKQTAFIDGDSAERWTYARLRETIWRLTAAFADRGLCKGDVICMYAPNSAWYACVLLAAMRLGVIVTGVNPLYTSEELWRQLLDSNSKYMFSVPELLPKITGSGDLHLKLKTIFVVGEASGCIPVRSLLTEGEDSVPRAKVPICGREGIALLPYSSGTTGLPKGVMLSHYNLIANVLQITHPNASVVKTDGALVVGIAPFFHVAGLIVNLFSILARKGTLVIMPSFDYHRYLSLVEKYKATTLMLVPPVLLRIVKDPEVLRYDLSSVRGIGVGSAPISPAIVAELSSKLGIKDIHQGWGMSETTCVGTCHPDDSVKYASVGKLVPNTEAKVVDVNSGAELGLNERGEICIRGPQNMVGYLNKPEQTLQTIDRDGWLHTGDIGYIDDDHYMYIVDRLKELIKYKGFQVAPAELESVLLEHPKVEDAAVFGIPHPIAGEVPRAYVVPKHGCSLTEKDVQDFVSGKVAPYKQLRGGVVLTDHIPKSASGKILRRLLQKQDSHPKSAISKL